MIPTVLSIAGSDPSGGAGIQADLKTFADHRVYGMAALTALTAQNTRGVSGVHMVPPSFVIRQIRDVLDDIPPAAVKIGMLGTVTLIEAVAEALADYRGPVVLDPVMVATSGARLLEPEAERALVEHLAPLATLLTPNLPEAERILSGTDPQAWANERGRNLLVKGGHAKDPVVRDVLYLSDGHVHEWEHPRVASRNTHGTGCTLSSAIAANLARGRDLVVAVAAALEYLSALIEHSAAHDLGGGHGPLLHAGVE